MKRTSLFVSVGVMVLLLFGCGGNNSETKSDTGFGEIQLTRKKLEKYVGFHQDWFEKVRGDASRFDEKSDLQDLGMAIRYGKKSEKEFEKILKKNGLDLDEFRAIDETFSTIMQAVIQEQFITSQSSLSANPGNQAIVQMQKILADPNFPDDQKKMVREQIKEMRENQLDMKQERTRVQAAFENFSPKNVELVREYIPKVWGIYGESGNLPQ